MDRLYYVKYSTNFLATLSAKPLPALKISHLPDKGREGRRRYETQSCQVLVIEKCQTLF